MPLYGYMHTSHIPYNSSGPWRRDSCDVVTWAKYVMHDQASYNRVTDIRTYFVFHS